jgi:ribonuclease P protein component
MELLFNKGLSNNAYPLKLIYIDTETDLQYPAQAMFVAPKRNFKHAHDRNTLKRRMREVYRLNKAGLYSFLEGSNQKKLLAFIYTGKKAEEYPVIEKAMLKHLKMLTVVKEKL